MSESTAVRKKADFSSLKTAARSLGNRNVILLIIFYSCMNYSCYYKNGFRGLLVMDDHGISATVYGTMISVFLICGLIMRTPGGAIIDRFRGNIKPIFIISSILKGGCALAYLYANSTATMYLAFILDGFLWSFVGVFPYALLATFVDRRIVGTAFALCEGISFIVGSSARGLGAKMFTELGVTIPTYISFGIQLVGVAAIFFFDNEKLKESAGLRRTEENRLQPQNQEKSSASLLKKVLGMFSVAALPFAILNGAQYIVYQIDGSFLPYYAEKMAFDYLTAGNGRRYDRGLYRNRDRYSLRRDKTGIFCHLCLYRADAVLHGFLFHHCQRIAGLLGRRKGLPLYLCMAGLSGDRPVGGLHSAFPVSAEERKTAEQGGLLAEVYRRCENLGGKRCLTRVV